MDRPSLSVSPIYTFSLSQVQFSGPASHMHLFCSSCPHAGKSDLLAPDWWTQTQQEPLMGSCTRSGISQKLLPLGRCFKSNTNKQLFLLEGSHSILPLITRRDMVLEWLRRYKHKMLRTRLAEKWWEASKASTAPSASVSHLRSQGWVCNRCSQYSGWQT